MIANPASIKLENDCLMVSGNLDFINVVNLLQTSLPLLSTCSQWRIDLSHTKSAKSAGLMLLLEWIKLAKKAKKSIRFISIPPELFAIASVCSLEKWLQTYQA
jgi:phospholipid transport system transporter-binding protein